MVVTRKDSVHATHLLGFPTLLFLFGINFQLFIHPFRSFDRVLYGPGWPPTYYVGKDDRDLLTHTLPLKCWDDVWTNIPSRDFFQIPKLEPFFT